jgi:hypothetical protein
MGKAISSEAAGELVDEISSSVMRNPGALISLARLKTADDYTYAWLDLAAVRWRLGDTSGARDALSHAERLGLLRVPVAVAAGWLNQQLGDTRASIRDYAMVISLAPTLVDDPFWSSPEGPTGGLSAILPMVPRTVGPATQLQMDLVLGHIDDAMITLERFAASDRDVYASLIAAWQGDPNAWLDLQAATARQPLDDLRIGLSQLVATHLGDQASIGRYRRWLEIVRAFVLPGAGRIMMGQPQPLPAHLLDRYGSLYRREVFEAQVVGLLPQIVWEDQP